MPFLDLFAKPMSSADQEAVSWDQPPGKEHPRCSSRMHQPSPRAFAWVGGEFPVIPGEHTLVATTTSTKEASIVSIKGLLKKHEDTLREVLTLGD